jgi:Flp pilus assembly secretin CpaC
MVEVIRKKLRSGRKLIAVAVGALGFFVFTGYQLAGSEARTVAVTLGTGEAYTIQDVSMGSTPAVRVVSNPGALVVHTDAPGKIVLLGAAAGSWNIDVTLANGERVTYAVEVRPASGGTGTLAGAASPPASPAAMAAAPGRSVPEGEPVRVASADPAGPVVAFAPPAAAPSLTTRPAAAPPAAVPSTTVAEASTPESSTSVPNSAAPIVAPSSSGGDNGMLPSQAGTAGALPPAQRFNTDPMAVIPTGPPPLGEKHFMPGDGVDLTAGTSEVLDYPARIRRVSIADSKVADIQVINPYELNLVAHQPGFTTLAVWDTRGRYSEREIRVDESGKQQVLLNVVVAELDRSRIENFGVNWSMALPKWNISLVNMAGGVATPYNATSALTANSLISSNPPITVSNTATGTLPPNGTIIPLLLSQNLTYGLAAGNNNIQTQSFFQFLEENSMGKILAEPHLLANSGEKAEFLSGGEIPIVISQALNTSIVFKQFGTSVIFVPTVIGFDDILLKVKPEVSEPDYAHGSTCSASRCQRS